MTKAIKRRLVWQHHERAGDNSPTVWLKLFTPDGAATWYLTEYDPEHRMFFGWCDLGMGMPELGYVSRDEIEAVRGKLGLPIERDKWWSPCPLSEVMGAA